MAETLKILLVDDNEDNRDLLSRRLGRRGYSVSVAAGGIEGLALAEAAPPDLVLLDLTLPDLDAYETCRRLRDAAATAQTPIIALSSLVMGDDRTQALAAGCDDYVPEPIEWDRLLTKIEALRGGRLAAPPR